MDVDVQEPQATEAPRAPALPPQCRTCDARPQVDPAVLLLVEELRRSGDALRADLTSAARETTAAVQVLSTEMRELRSQAPSRLTFYLASAVVALALVAVLGLLASRGVDVGAVSDAVHTLTPTAGP